MTILVTTPRGKIGSEVATLLRERRIPVRLAAHSVEPTRERFPGFDVVPFDYADPSTFDAALDGVTAVYLAAPADSPAVHERQFVAAAKRSGASKIVKLSALGVENTEAPLRQVEKYVESSGLAWTILRPTWFNQNFATAHREAIRAGHLAEPAGNAKTAFVDARDVAAVGVEALTKSSHGGRTYTLTGPELLDRHRVAKLLSEAIGRSVTYTPIDDARFRAAASGTSHVDLLSALYAGVRAGATERKTNTVEEILGRAPISFAAFARDYRASWR